VDEGLSYYGREIEAWDVDDQIWISPSGKVFKVNSHYHTGQNALQRAGWRTRDVYVPRADVHKELGDLGYARVKQYRSELNFDVQLPLKRTVARKLNEIQLSRGDDISLVWEIHDGGDLVDAGEDFQSFWKRVGYSIYINTSLFQINARRLAEIFFDQATGTWRYVVAGRRVPDFRIKMGVQRVANAVQRDLRDLTGRLVNGEISRQQWYDAMRSTMKQEYRAAYLASIGGLENYDRSEISKFGWRMRPHYRWLDNFLAEIESGKQPLNGFAVVRAGMYGRAANGIYQNERMRVAAEAGFFEARRKLGPNEEHCESTLNRPGCVELADMGWMPIAEMIPIGEATCLSHCLCEMEFRK